MTFTTVDDILKHKAVIDTLPGVGHDPDGQSWKITLAFAKALGFRLKGWNAEEGTFLKGGEPPEDERYVARLSFDNGEVWNAYGDDHGWKIANNTVMPFPRRA